MVLTLFDSSMEGNAVSSEFTSAYRLYFAPPAAQGRRKCLVLFFFIQQSPSSTAFSSGQPYGSLLSPRPVQITTSILRMSKVSPEQPDFDFWDFVCCAKCRMPFALDNGSATIPFWLTECGHIICNSHLNPDQSCSQCGAQDIQLAPLQREMEAPMSDWFQPIPLALDSIATAAKFQQENMAAQLRYYTSRHHQYRQLVERLKQTVSELKKANESLQLENERYRSQMDPNNRIPSHSLNGNGKRPMLSMQQFKESSRPRTGSSPHSLNVPLAPNRLTLLPGQQVPELSSHNQQEVNRRPASSRSLEQYAYGPQERDTYHAPPLTHAQTASRIFQRNNQPQNEARQGPHSLHGQNQQVPPTPSRFKPAVTSNAFTSNQANLGQRRQMQMGPPPTPQHARTQNSGQNPMMNSGPSRQSYLPAPPARQSVTSVPSTPSMGQQQAGGAGSRRFFPAASQSSNNFSSVLTSRPSIANASGSGQRTPFVPHAGQKGPFG
ncbi:unnamed protein product [Cyclocybe aegerita]|uniref:RING-type domain-containing protein n=1 Tax=Cyclocybe aegerita TaxID=1973307 RepID=A0A8S0WUD5_CYCAE|nr:unnamed protein product [Cyclocybe aegerita]